MENTKVLKNRFMILDELGSGGYGTVNRAHDKQTNKMVAVKFVSNLTT